MKIFSVADFFYVLFYNTSVLFIQPFFIFSVTVVSFCCYLNGTQSILMLIGIDNRKGNQNEVCMYDPND